MTKKAYEGVIVNFVKFGGDDLVLAVSSTTEVTEPLQKPTQENDDLPIL